MQTADEASRQVDGRCLVSIFSLPVAAVTASALAPVAVVRVTGCPQNHFTEPS